MAEGDLGQRRRQLHHPRHAVQHGHGAEADARRRGAAGRRSDAVSRGRRSTPARRSSTAASSPASTASRSASSSTGTPSASTTKAKTSGRSATRSGAGSSRSSPIRSPTRSSTRSRAACSCRRCFRRSWRDSIRELARQLGLSPDALERTVTAFNRAVRPGTFDHAVLDDCRTAGPDAGQDALGAGARHAAVLGLPAEAGHHVHLSRAEGRRTRARADDERQPRRTTSSRPARSWPATSSARATSPASG